MNDKENSIEIEELTRSLSNAHFPQGPMYQRCHRLRAEYYFKTNELKAIYHLVESHSPGLRTKAALRFEKCLTSSKTNKTLNKNNLDFNCSVSEASDNVRKMLEQVRAMPSEWTLVQLTPRFNREENLQIDPEHHYTNSLFISVFNCGRNKPNPFCVYVDAPKDPVNGNVVPLNEEIHSIIKDHRAVLSASKGKTKFRDGREKTMYNNTRRTLDDRLQMLTKELQDMYLKEWRCLLIGRYTNEKIESKICEQIRNFFKLEAPAFILTEKNLLLIHYLIKGVSYLKATELVYAVQTICSDSSLRKKISQFIRKTSISLKLETQHKHPVLLLIDESLDSFPWEMIDVLSGASVSRLPSLHFAYALYEEHKDSIKNGFKIVQNPYKGTYIINPDLDLKKMQNRILSFYEYWLPSWEGVAGIKPTETEVQNLLLSGEVFVYNGHGGGTHIFSYNRTERIRIKSVVFLFGCSSVKMNFGGLQCEMYSTDQVYLIACSPCVIGNLWEVTDLEMDTISSELLSLWIPNPQKEHWRQLDKSKWKHGERVKFENRGVDVTSPKDHEPNLLKVISLARKLRDMHYMNTAALVARGIPVKIVNK